MRELKRAALHHNSNISILTETAGAPEVERFVKKERLAGVAVTSVQALTNPLPSETPAAIAVNLRTLEFRGIAHPERVPNTRPRSFSAELDAIDAWNSEEEASD